MEKNKVKIGDTIKIGRTEYTIVAEFSDNYKNILGEEVLEHLYVGRKTDHNGHTYYYANIIRWNDEEGKWCLRT